MSSSLFKDKSITFLLNSFPNPSETFISDEIESLISQGCDVTVYSMQTPKKGVLHKNAKKILDKGIVRYLDPPSKKDKIFAFFKMCFKPKELLAFFQLDAPRWIKLEALVYKQEVVTPETSHIHCHYALLSSQIAFAINAFTKIPFSITTHGHDVFFGPPENYLALANRATEIIAISDFNRRYLIEKYNLPEEKVKTRRCGIEMSPFFNLQLKKLYLGEAVELLTVARLHPVKGHAFLLEALKSLVMQDQLDVRLSLVGDGLLRAELEILAESLGVAERVTFCGEKNSEEVLRYIADAHIFVLPSLSEGIPISMMEAMAGFTPVIGPDVNGVSELVGCEQEGILFTPGDSSSLQHAIREMISRSEEFENIVSNARKKVVNEYSINKNVCAKYLEILGPLS